MNTRFWILVFVMPFLAHCSAISDLIEDITNADCDDFVLLENDDTLNEACRDLQDYLDSNTDNLAGLSGEGISQLFPLNDLADSKIAVMQLTDATGTPLSGIESDDVTVEVSTNDGASFTGVAGSTVETLGEIDTTQSALVTTIDYSGSILDDDLDDVVDGLDVFFENLDVGYEAAVVKFSTDVDLIQDFTTDSAALLAAVDDTSYDRDLTSLNDAIYDSVTALSLRDKPLKIVVLFTDGVDNDSEHTQDEAVTLAQDNSVAVCVVGVGFADVATLREIAEDTGCFFVYKTLFTDLGTAFDAFVDQIEGLYAIELPDSFNTASGLLRVTVDAGESEVRQFTGEF